jgi:hypothetical protein
MGLTGDVCSRVLQTKYAPEVFEICDSLPRVFRDDAMML